MGARPSGIASESHSNQSDVCLEAVRQLEPEKHRAPSNWVFEQMRSRIFPQHRFRTRQLPLFLHPNVLHTCFGVDDNFLTRPARPPCPDACWFGWESIEC